MKCSDCGALIQRYRPVHFSPRPQIIEYRYTDMMTAETGREVRITRLFTLRMNDFPDNSKFRTIGIESAAAGKDFAAFQNRRSPEAFFFIQQLT